MTLTKSCSSPDLIMKSVSFDTLSLHRKSCKDSTKSDDDDSIERFELREDPNFWKEHNVQVIIRIRPLSSHEVSSQGHGKCIRQDTSQTITWIGHPESRFTFDLVANENVSQEMMFKVAGVPMVDNCMTGYNSCMFAYGQTGSGKTHTMLGDIEGGARRHSANCGMTPRVFDYLFSRIQKEKDSRREEKLKFTCRCSFLEIYNEQIIDLLDPSSTNLQIREDSKKGIHVENITEVEVTSARDVIQQLIQGAANRKVAATNMNQASSRSHSVFTCIVESKWESQGVTLHRFARLNLVDLAGSERQKSTGADGERLKEATNINKSLSTLGLVIMNLVNISNGKSLHVPYRDSKLTFLLQDSLGGNAKTIIIANISPSSCCSFETLSTLKFAQRAKFIKNHAIVNEDASGNVLALRLENQNLKKEITRLRALVDGGVERHDTLTSTFPGSPGSIEWAGQLEFSSPLLSAKKYLEKDNDAALVGAIRMVNDKDMLVQALAAEKEAAMQLAKKREEDVQCLKMMLKFREAAIRRLEAVASKQMPAESHLATERNEHLKEIEVLRSQVERNHQATRFAMEKLELEEEIRRLKSFCEDGERERMEEQIVVLQNKLLDALDWKLMHQPDLSPFKKQTHDHNEDDLLNSNKESDSIWQPLLNEENEFLKLQVIQYQSEINSLREKLELYIEEKEKLERCVTDLEKELEEEKLSKMNMVDDAKKEIDSLMNTLNTERSNQTEIEAMVDAIAAASQREAEAHETAIFLSKENDELRVKVKNLGEENNKVVELYKNLVIDTERNSCNGSAVLQRDGNEVSTQVSEEEWELKREIERLKSQLAEMHEENDKLFGLYENAMHEKDEIIREISSKQRQTVDKDGGYRSLEEEPETLLGEADLYDVQLKDESSQCSESEEVASLEDHIVPVQEIILDEASLYDIQVKDDSSQSPDSNEPDNIGDQVMPIHVLDEGCFYDVQVKDVYSRFDFPDLYEPVEESKVPQEQESGMMDNTSPLSGEILEKQELLPYLCAMRKKLADALGKLADSAEIVSMLSSLEKMITEVDGITENIAIGENRILEKKNKCEQLKVDFAALLERKDQASKKLSAVKHSMTSFASSLGYFEKREAMAMSKLYLSALHLNRDKDQLASLQSSKQELVDALSRIRDTETKVENIIISMNSKIEEKNQKVESERILFTIDSNIDKPSGEALKRAWQVQGKATALLEAEEERVKLQKQMNLQKEQLVALKKETEVKSMELHKIEMELQALEIEVQKEALCTEESNRKLQTIVQEKTMLLEVQEDGKLELENLILDYHQCCFDADIKKEETRLMQQELMMESRELENLKKSKEETRFMKAKLLEAMGCNTSSMSEKVVADVQSARVSVEELCALLEHCSSSV